MVKSSSEILSQWQKKPTYIIFFFSLEGNLQISLNKYKMQINNAKVDMLILFKIKRKIGLEIWPCIFLNISTYSKYFYISISKYST